MTGFDAEISMIPANPYCPYTCVPDHIRRAEKLAKVIAKSLILEVKGFSCCVGFCDLDAKPNTSGCNPLLSLDGEKLLMCPYCRKLKKASIAEIEKGEICEMHKLYYMMPFSGFMPR